MAAKVMLRFIVINNGIDSADQNTLVWKAEIQPLQAEYDGISKEKSKTATELAYADARVIIRPSQRNPVKSRV